MEFWDPDTCYCKIRTERPSVNGEFIKRCRIHANSRNTLDVTQHNRDNQERQETNDRIRDEKKAITREATRP